MPTALRIGPFRLYFYGKVVQRIWTYLPVSG
jgi:hypothetical protein